MSSPPPRRPWIYLALLGGVLLAYLPALGGGFIWDDAGHVTRADLTSPLGLWRIWTELGATQQYYPMVHTAFWLEHRLWGDAALGYHLVNVLEHAAAACLLVALLRKLRIPGAELAGACFALTPVAVESVAWVAEQKNTLSAVFYFSAALAYLGWEEMSETARPTRPPSPFIHDGHWWAATICFAAAVLTKSVTATLPAALLVVRWWQTGRLTRRDFIPLSPWLLGGAAAGWFTSWIEKTYIGADGSGFRLEPAQRLLLLSRAPWFYLGKLAWPAELSFVYPRWRLDPADAANYLWVIATAALLAGAGLLAQRGRRGPLAAAFYFGGTLLPALGLVDVYPFRYSYVADHFQYLALLGVLVPVAALLAARPAGRAAAGAVLLVWFALTWRQAKTYHDEGTVWRATLAQNDQAWLAEGNLGSWLVERGQTAEALPHFERAIQIAPEVPEVRNSYGDALNQVGRAAEAVPQLERAVQLAPGSAEAHNNLGVSRMMTGQAQAGLKEFQTAVALRPAYGVAERNLGLALATGGRTAEALPHFQRAAELDPRDGQAQLNWGIALAVSGRMAEAEPHLAAATAAEPNSADARQKHARVLRSLGRIREAQAEEAAAQALLARPGAR